MIDISAHIMPYIDDGAKTIKETLELIEEAEKNGFSDIFLTSHYIEEKYEADSKERRSWLKSLQMNVKQKKINIKLYNGAQVFISTNLPKLIKYDAVPTLNDSRYVLVELPQKEQFPEFMNIINELKELEIVPIITHPETYEYIQKDVNIIKELVSNGILIQCNFGSIINMNGKIAEKTMKKMLKDNMVHFLGTDVKRKNSVYCNMDLINAKIDKIIGSKMRNKITIENPRKVIDNEEIVLFN